MLVSNNNLLNILLPNENRVLKDVLKEADVKTLNNLKAGTTSVEDILKNLFSDLSTGNKNKSTIENILKNSNIFKDLGSFTKSIESLLSTIKENPSLAKHKPLLESFLKNISEIDNNSLKDLISKSGVFLEAKVLDQSKASTNLPRNLETILGQIKTILNNIPNQALNIKNIENLIDKILQNNSNTTSNTTNSSATNQTIQTNLASSTNPNLNNTNISDLKALISQLQNLVNSLANSSRNNQLANLDTLTNSLKELPNQSQLSESKVANQSSLLAQQNIVKIVNQLESFVNNFINKPSFSLQGNEKNIQQQNPLQNDIKTMLFKVQEELLSRTDTKSTDTLKQVDKMLMQVEYYQLLSIVSNSNSVYIPFIWDLLDDGSISIKKTDEEKFYCEINLSLKEFGQTQLLLSLYDKNRLDLTIYASKESFKQSIRENITKLKQALNSVNLIPVNINILELKKEEEKSKEEAQVDVYSQNANLGFGVDIKA